MSTVLTETNHTGEHLVSEANGHRSREVGTITGGKFQAGTVLGQITASKKWTILAPAATDGSQTAAAVLFEGCDATSVDQSRTLHVRSCEVNGLVIVWPAGITNPQKTAAVASLAAAGIIVRS